MSWQGLYFSQAARLSLKNSALHIERGKEECIDLPLEDISYIILESPQVTITSALLAACLSYGCFIITCDEKHLPNGLLLPVNTYYQPLYTLSRQLALSLPRKKRLWQEIIRAKIINQASCLQMLRRDNKSVSMLNSFAAKVKSGDQGNVEAAAARLYWSCYAPDFKRDADGENRLNSMLNYCYALARAAISRELAARGFVPALGIHHCGKQNPFNLADDLIEPWRPLADAFVFGLWQQDSGKEELDPKDKQAICGFLHSQVRLPDGQYEFLQAVQVFIDSIKRYYEGGRGKILFPDFAL
jgi:CRISPR-associated protein Cas1